MRVAVDAMGGDHGPSVVVEGAVAAARHADVGVTLVGDSGQLLAELARHPDAARLDILVVHAADAVGMGERPAEALRRKPRSSIRVAAGLVSEGAADALFSAGNTGATVVAAYTAFGLLRGADRPALAATVPTMRGTAVLLDIGANADCRPPHLVAFAAMGTVFARVGLGIAAPEVGVLSIGQEAGKGNELTREAHRLLRATPLRFVGNVEARDLYSGAADVVVCDGFTGNVVIKVSEGVVGMVERMLGEEFAAMGGEGARLAVDAVGRFRARVDYAEYGGAPLLGVGRPTVVAHGRSSARAVTNAIRMAARFAGEGLAPRIEQELLETAS
ncbi:MAG TPA: phosphate acyltransferase PlsX [Vicinamibacterales bacterium]|nr:phosphate acyltransferase PlsX [Vicinamibacterales bacterium]